MKDLREYFEECRKELDVLGIPYGNIRSVTVNHRAKRRWGQCRRVGTDENGNIYDINIKADLLHDEAPERGLTETTIHEILHTVPGGHGHKGAWKKYANIVNGYYGYDITRINSDDKKGMKQFYEDHPERARKIRRMEYRYIYKCTSCGGVLKRKKASRFTRNYERYTCRRCGGRFIEISADDE